jgi:CRP-like cAMP-binding protein
MLMPPATDQSQYVHLLANVPLFKSLPEEDLGSFAKELRMVEIPAGETVFEEGQVGEHFYVVLTGTLRIVKHMGLAFSPARGR